MRQVFQLLKKPWIVLGILCGSFLTSCQSPTFAGLSQEEGISTLRKEFEEQEWTELIAHADEYRARYPYSRFNPEAEFLQASAYYFSDRYPEAIAAYQNFVRKNPNDKNAPVARFRIGRAYDLQDPPAPDREQENAKKALSAYKYYVQNDPNGESVAEANERIVILSRRLAEHGLFVARFYWQRGEYAASLLRYLRLLEEAGDYQDIKSESVLRAFYCYDKLASLLEKKRDNDKYVYFKNSSPKQLREKALELKKTYPEVFS